MSLFEFVTVMISMILALSLGQLLSGISFLLKTERAIHRYLPHSLWLACIGVTVINHWWSLWDFRDLAWDYAAFIYILVAPTLVSVAVGLIAPDQSGSGPIDLQTQFARVRRTFAAVFSIYVLAMWFDGPLLAGHEPLGVIGSLHIPILASALVPLFTDNRRANVIAPCGVLFMLVLVMLKRFLG